MCRIDTGHLPLGTDLPVPRGQVGLHTGDSWGPDHKVQPGCTMVGAKGGRSLGIGPNGIQKRPARGHRRVRSMAPAGGRPGVQPGPSWVSCWVLGSLLPLGHGRGSRAARDWARQGGANRRRPRACRPWVDGVRSTPLRPGSPGPPERTHACGGLGVSRDDAARRKNSCASRPKTHPPSKKTSGTAAVRTGAAGQRVQPLCGTSRRKRR